MSNRTHKCTDLQSILILCQTIDRTILTPFHHVLRSNGWDSSPGIANNYVVHSNPPPLSPVSPFQYLWNNTENPATMTDSKYFTTTKKGEIFELKSELNNDKKEKKKEAVKKVRD